MKKIVLFSFFILSSAMMTSCTADDIIPAQNQVADDPGGQQGIPTPPPPPPPPPGFGDGSGRMGNIKI